MPDPISPSERQPDAVADRRRRDRAPFGGTVVVRVRDLELGGEGRNMSAGGVHVVVDQLPMVTVRIEGQDRAGELVRLENLGAGRVGLAIRFVDA